jgi:hypothetical protein
LKKDLLRHYHALPAGSTPKERASARHLPGLMPANTTITRGVSPQFTLALRDSSDSYLVAPSSHDGAPSFGLLNAAQSASRNR